MNICIYCPEGHPVNLVADKLGQMVACPRCFATFRADLEIGGPLGARKSSRARDDDDDDDDEEEERPKKKPVAKKPTRSRARDDDEDDDDDEEEEEEGQEPEIEWTRRKRQLNTCGIGLMIMMVAYCMLIAMEVGVAAPMMWFLHKVGNETNLRSDKLATIPPDNWDIFGYVVAPTAGVALTTLVIGLFFNLFVPARSGARGMVLCALIFAGLTYLMGALILMRGAVSEDAARQANMVQLFATLGGLCWVVCFMSAMAYMSKMMIFMKLNLEASQPVTNTMFYLLYFAALFGIFIANPYICYYLFWFACYAMVAVVFFCAAMAVRMAVAQVKVFLKVRGLIIRFLHDDV